ncbi:MAG: DUF512 domain-containing protein [Candidatus Cloacimonetes bacterium]|nr:DUF512 domain-containing protein [Candidatus Cloacimonadota bacterium]
MPLYIASIAPQSLASQAGIQSGESLVSINAQPINDFLDLEYYSSDYHLEMVIQDVRGKKRRVHIYRELAQALGIIPQPYKHRNCQNNCIFCFIDQMPKQLRKTLYMKDDDYVFSFVYGNYITLTNLSAADYRRIYKQHISPLYISLHSTDAALRQKMMRSRNPLDPMQALRRLARHDISYHLQIVCVPGYNDGEELSKSLKGLLKSKLPILSIGVVPVGLTRYREGLCDLQTFDQSGAEECLDIITELRYQYDSEIVYPADEFYVMSQRPIPEDDYYQDYPQLENGIGMLRMTMENYKLQKRRLLKTLRSRVGSNYHLMCSSSAENLMQYIVRDLNKLLKGQKVELQVIRNDYMGEQISVAGLITYSDIVSQLSIDPGVIGILPNCILNQDAYSLDGHHRDELNQLFPQGLLLVDPLFESWDWL